MTARTAFWRRLHVPGHDTATLTLDGEAWRLTGTAVFHDDGLPVAAQYELILGPDWRSLRGAVRGTIGGTPFGHEIVRGPDGWRVDGQPMGLGDLIDLDFGFTPATNMPQIRRMNLAVGEATQITVAWFDLGEDKLQALPQRYRRIEDRRYAYESPQGGYAATLEMAETGFVSLYPGLWQMED